MGQISVELRDGEVHITVHVQVGESAALDAMAVEALITEWGKLRARMHPAAPRDRIPDQEAVAVGGNLRCYSEPEWSQGNPVLHIRDPRFGWLHFVLPKVETKNLAGLLHRQAEDHCQERPPGKAN